MIDPPAHDLPVFVALDVGRTVTDDGATHPTVVIDVREHPEVADLARVHAIEGIGDVRTVAARSAGAILLGVHMSSPVTAMFAVLFDDAQSPFLEEVADCGALTIATTDPDAAGRDRPWWLAVDIDGPALRRVLHG